MVAAGVEVEPRACQATRRADSVGSCERTSREAVDRRGVGRQDAARADQPEGTGLAREAREERHLRVGDGRGDGRDVAGEGNAELGEGEEGDGDPGDRRERAGAGGAVGARCRPVLERQRGEERDGEAAEIGEVAGREGGEERDARKSGRRTPGSRWSA